MTLLMMTAYLMLTLGKMTCFGARPWLALSAVLILVCALSIGFSVSLCLGTPFNTIVMLVPFILLGVGVDGICYM